MLRDIDINEISDGHLYTSNDMVKAECNDCVGCSACCRGMGTSIVLDPLDVYQLTGKLNRSFEDLLSKEVELQVSDGLILPCLKMTEEGDHCAFLNQQGRCSVHSFRPGFCRMFPLGRIYENGTFRYFLQTGECKKENRTKVKIRKWIGVPDIKRYEAFICSWHYFLKDVGTLIQKDGSESVSKNANMYLLKQFYLTGYHTEEAFYPQFEERLEKARQFFF